MGLGGALGAGTLLLWRFWGTFCSLHRGGILDTLLLGLGGLMVRKYEECSVGRDIIRHIGIYTQPNPIAHARRGLPRGPWESCVMVWKKRLLADKFLNGFIFAM